MIYKREEKSGHTVEWEPDDKNAAEQAMQDVVGEIGVKVDNETAREIRKRYQESVQE